MAMTNSDDGMEQIVGCLLGGAIGDACVVLAIQAAWRGVWNGDPELIAHIVRHLPDSRVRDRMFDLAKLDPSTPLQQLANEYGTSGYTVESVPLALFAAQQARESDFTAWIRGVIVLGGDTDTIASMAAQVVGCRLGGARIPDDLITRIPNIEQVRAKITVFAAHVKRATT